MRKEGAFQKGSAQGRRLSHGCHSVDLEAEGLRQLQTLQALTAGKEAEQRQRANHRQFVPNPTDCDAAHCNLLRFDGSLDLNWWRSDMKVNMRRMRRMAAAILLASFAASSAAIADDASTSCADCPQTNGEFTIKNNTSMTINYKVKWGEKGDWSKANQLTLTPGQTERHSHGLDGNGRAPTPRIRLDIDTTGNNNFQELL